MSTALELHELNLRSSSKLKLRGTALLAEGSDDAVFEACVLFHEAARLERRAVQALSHCPPETRLAGLIEECWCLLEARDPDAAAAVWSDIILAQDAVPASSAEAMLTRLRPRYDKVIREFVRIIQQNPVLSHVGKTQVLVPSTSAEQRRVLLELERMLKVFPGIAELWAGVARLAEVTGDRSKTWWAVQRALRLRPDSAKLKAFSLVLVVDALPIEQAEQHLREVQGLLSTAEAEVCLTYAFAELQLADAAPRERSARLRRALSAVNTGFARAHVEWVRKCLTALQLYIEALLARQKPGSELLYRAGLGRLAATSGRNPIDALRVDVIERLGAMSAA